MKTRRPTAGDHADQTSTATIRHAADESAPATVGGDIVATLAGLQRTETGKNRVKRRYSVTYNRL